MNRTARLSALLLALAAAACASDGVSPVLPSGRPAQARGLGANGNFGSGDLTGWTYGSYLNNTGVTVPPQSFADLRLDPGPAVNLTRVLGGATETIVPAGLTSSATLRVPKFGSTVAVINEQGKNNNVNALSQVMTVGVADIDPADGLVHVRLAIAPVLQSGNHAPTNQPFYWVSIANKTSGLTLFNGYSYANSPGTPWQSIGSVYYTNWTAFDVAPGNAVVHIGDQLQVTLLASGCSAGGHFGEIYAGGFGAFLPGPAVSAHAPQQANVGGAITYAYRWRNGAATPAANATVSINLPAGTTFQSMQANGASCTTPGVGAAGNVTCALGTLSPGSYGTFTVAVNVPAATPTNTVDHGDYEIFADGISPLLGPTVHTALTSAVSYADLAVHLSDGVTAVAYGQALTYTLTVANAGPIDAIGTTVTENAPAALTGLTWTCAASSGGGCAAASGSGAIASTVDLPGGATATFTIHATVAAGTGLGTLLHAATAAPPAGISDPDTTNNTDVDADFTAATLHTVTAATSGAGTGTIASSPQAIACGATCSASFAGGSSVGLTAVPDAGYAFLGWSGGACAGQGNPCVIGALAADTTVTAQFDVAHYITTQVVGGVGGISCPTAVAVGGTASCTVSPGAGNAATSLTDNGVDVLAQLASGVYTLTNMSADHALAVGFTGQAGGACSVAASCSTGFCADGVCCNTACSGLCAACDLPSSFGVCTAIATMAHGARPPCNADQPGSGCGGACGGGSQNCTYPAAGTPAPVACLYGNNELVSDVCSGTGYYSYTNGSYANCTVGCAADGQHCSCATTADCSAGQSCSGGICRQCATDADCAGVAYCSALMCVPKWAAAVPCVAAHQCCGNICAANGLCGGLLGDSGCTPGAACQAGACSASSHACLSAGACRADGDCQAGAYCVGASHCAPQLASGVPLPADGVHGACVSGANAACVAGGCNAVAQTCAAANGAPCSGASQCEANACGSNGACGLADGDSGCTAGTPGRCQSGACGAGGQCRPSGGCNVDADCPAGTWCEADTGSCRAPADVGFVLPEQGPNACHDGVAAGACASGHCNVATRTCAQLNGRSCAIPAHCVADACDVDGACGLLADRACSGDGACRNGLCVGGRCNAASNIVASGHGLFSCAGGAGGGPAMWLLALVMVARAKRRRLAAASAVALLLIVGQAGPANAAGTRLTRWVAAAPGSRWLGAESLVPGGAGTAIGDYPPGLASLVLRLDGDWAHDPLVVGYRGGQVLDHVVADQAGLGLAASIQALEGLRVDLQLPLQVAAHGQGAVAARAALNSPSHAVSFGDVRLGATVRHPTRLGAALHLGVGARMWLPTGQPSAYSGAGAVTADILATAAGEAGLLVWSASVGVDLAPRGTVAGVDVGPGLLAVGAVGVQNRGRTLLAGLEVPLATVISSGRRFHGDVSAVDPTLGLTWRALPQLGVRGGFGTGLTRGLGEPRWRAVIGVEARPWCRGPADAAPAPAVAPRPIAAPLAPRSAAASAAPAAAPVPPPGVAVALPTPAAPTSAPAESSAPAPAVRIEADRITLAGKVNFASGTAEIAPESVTILEALATTLRAHPEIDALRVEGHTDASGRAATNLSLSRRRAAAVVAFLATHGVAESRLTAAGYGQSRPLAANETPEGRATNRRVEFVIVAGAPGATPAAGRHP